ncbi:LOW QUALITY PROTEIN: uncharacterized protein LOC117329606 [Pecten maximus]|uniref:LOW QUALITY PROTEIN: uncharacterized protein LOC117329606 n=1 Tax=Pecten maximus TaxID=6579 RepID=UPI001458F682|nr:LOW QUALITY PROTEIN: uncharacterized protein LOC117329606 [Pecten maximus]
MATHQRPFIPSATMLVTNESLNSFITNHVQPAISKWEAGVKSLKKGDSKGKTVQEERRRFLEKLLHEMSGDVLLLQINLGYQSHPSVSNSDRPKPSRISDDMLRLLGDWRKQANTIKAKNKTKDIQGKSEELRRLLFQIQGNVAFWSKFVNQNKPNQEHQQQRPSGSNAGGPRQQPSHSPANVSQTADGRQLPSKHSADTQFTAEERNRLLEEINVLHMKLDSKKAEYRENISEQNTNMEKLRKEVARQKEEFDAQDMELRQVRRQKEEALTRLSEIAGQKLRQNNPGIADLSSENRPTKIAERFKELYANEWTDAFTELTTKFEEKKTVDILLMTLLESYEFTVDIADKHLKQLKYSAQMPTFIEEVEDEYSKSREKKGDQGTKQMPVQLSDECADLLKQLRKTSASAFVQEIQDSFVKQRQVKVPEVNGSPAMIKFNKACVDITWAMNVQTPPLVFAPKPATGTPVQTELYSLYTQSGDVVDYVVWLACLLHKDGPLLAKGVLQPFKVERRKGAQGDRKSVVDPDNINSFTKDKNNKGVGGHK